MSRKFPLVSASQGSGFNLGITLPPAVPGVEPCPDCPPPSGDCVIGPPLIIRANRSPSTVAPCAIIYCPGLEPTDTIVWSVTDLVTDGTLKYMNNFGREALDQVLVTYIDSPTTAASATFHATVNGVDVGSVDLAM